MPTEIIIELIIIEMSLIIENFSLNIGKGFAISNWTEERRHYIIELAITRSELHYIKSSILLIFYLTIN